MLQIDEQHLVSASVQSMSEGRISDARTVDDNLHVRPNLLVAEKGSDGRDCIQERRAAIALPGGARHRWLAGEVGERLPAAYDLIL